MSDPFHILGVREDFTIEVCDLGASLYQIYLNGMPLLYAPDKETFCKPNKEYFGQFVGPIAGRIKGGVCKDLQLEINEPERGNCLHSGSECFAWKPFKREVSSSEGGMLVRFTREDQIQGRRYRAFVEYALARAATGMAISFGIQAIDACPANPTMHMYFSLGEESIEKVELAGKFQGKMAYDENLVPLGFKKVEGEELRLDRHLDHAFSMGEHYLLATGKKADVIMETDAEGIIVYTDAASKTKTGRCKGFTLECVAHPDQKDLWLEPMGTLEVTTRYVFSAFDAH